MNWIQCMNVSGPRRRIEFNIAIKRSSESNEEFGRSLQGGVLKSRYVGSLQDDRPKAQFFRGGRFKERSENSVY